MRRATLLLVGLGWGLVAQTASGQSAAEKLDAALRPLRGEPYIHSALGVTRNGTPIPCVLTADDLDYRTKKTRILLIGGLDGSADSVSAVVAMLKWFRDAPHGKLFHKHCAVSAVPCANPDGWAAGKGASNGSGGEPRIGYPPKGEAYNSTTDPEAAYLWRWVGMHAPDLVVEVRSGTALSFHVPPSDLKDLERLFGVLPGRQRHTLGPSLVSELTRRVPCGVGNVPALAVEAEAKQPERALMTLLGQLPDTKFTGPSPARKELQSRLDRSPIEVAKQLASRYGRDLKEVSYIPAMALVGRLRLGELTKDEAQRKDVERIVADYREGKKPALKSAGAVAVAAHLVFGELAQLTKDPKYVELVRGAAEAGFAKDGTTKGHFPGHSDMSDAVFMHCPLLARAGRLTGEKKYFDLCLSHLRFMRKLCARKDDLYRHSPLDEAAWGRGNGFPALGLALALTDFPADHPGRDEMLRHFRGHMEALQKHQDPTGAWHQVIDVPGSYREFSCTAMVTFAMARGVRLGWLPRDRYGETIRRGWDAVRVRVAADGGLVDVCTGTGKQKSLRAYFDRAAILGPDARGGAMALLVATEMAEYEAAAAKAGGR